MTLEEKVLEFRRTGDFDYGKEILAHSYELANIIISKNYAGFGYKDDLLSESHDAIVVAINTFDESKSKFPTFCSSCIKNRINNFVRKIKNRNKYRPIENLVDRPILNLIDIKEFLNNLDNNSLDSLLLRKSGKGSNYISQKSLLKKLNKNA